MEHGRAFGRGFEQVAEFAPDVGTDHVAVIGHFKNAVGPFFDIDVEVIAPEIDQHLLELALGIDRAHQLGLFELADDRDGAPLVGHLDHFGHVVLGLGRNLFLRGRLTCRRVLGEGRGLLLLLEIFFAFLQKERGELLRTHLEHFKLRHFLLHGGVVDGFGMQLLVDVIVQAHFLDGLDIARTGAKGDAIEDMDNFSAIRGRARRRFLAPGRARREEEKTRREGENEPGQMRMCHIPTLDAEAKANVTTFRIHLLAIQNIVHRQQSRVREP